jgi:predicted PurR-regulated permease PerM
MQTQIARRVQILLTLGILVAATYLFGVTWSFVSQFMSIFMLFFLAWLLAYLLKPLVLWLTRARLPFWAAVLFVYIIGPAILVVVGYLVIPAITGQATQIANHLDDYSSKLTGLVDSAKGMLASLGVSASDVQGLENKIRDAAGGVGQAVLEGGIGSIGGIGNEVFRITLVIIFSVSFLVDGDKMASAALSALPERWRGGATTIVQSVETSFGSFVRGQLFSAFVYALLNAVVMVGFGLPNVAIGALLAGLLIIVPLVGNYLAYIPPLIICLVARPDQALIMFIVLAVMQSIYLNVISPRIMARAVKMNPLVTTASILVLGQLGGFWGALFGIPIASTIGMLARPTLHLVQNYLNPASDTQPQTEMEPAPAALPLPSVEPADVDGAPNEGTASTSLSTGEGTI